MRRGLRAIAPIAIAGLLFAISGCATLEWLGEAEQKKNQWLRETFFGQPLPN